MRDQHNECYTYMSLHAYPFISTGRKWPITEDACLITSQADIACTKTGMNSVLNRKYSLIYEICFSMHNYCFDYHRAFHYYYNYNN